MRKNLIGWILLLCLMLQVLSLSGQVEVQGRITNTDQVPLRGIPILGVKSGILVTSDAGGQFRMQLPDPDTLLIGGIAQTPIRVYVRKDTILEISLEPTIVLLPTMVVQDQPLELAMPLSFLRIRQSELQRDLPLQYTSVLNRVPGLFMHSGTINTNRITIRGIGSRSPFSTTRIRIYLNDIPLTGGDGISSLEDIDFSLIDGIEVWKGPTASMYGAGLGGMIHLQTRMGSPSSFLRSTSTFGSFGLFRQTVSVRLADPNGNSGFRAAWHQTQQDGWRENSDYRREGGYLIGYQQLNDRHEVQWLADYTRVKAFIPSSIDQLDYAERPNVAAASWSAVKGFESYEKQLAGISLRSNWLDKPGWKLSSQMSPFYRNRIAEERRPFDVLEENTRVLGLRARIDLDRKAQSNADFPFLTFGVETFFERYNWQTRETLSGGSGNLLSDNEEYRNYVNLFLQNCLQFGRGWTLFTGVNYNHTSYDYQDQFLADTIDLSGQYSFKPILSPRFGLNYRIGYLASFFGTISHGFAPPTLSETLTPDGAVNPEIKPERGWNFELGSRGRLWQQLGWEVSIYRMLVTDLLVARRIGPDRYIGLNAGATRHDGLEVFLYWEPSLGAAHFQLFAGYTLTDYRFTDFIEDGRDYSGNRLTGTAPHQFSTGIDWSLPFGLYGNFTGFGISSFPILDDNSLYSEPYTLWHTRVGYRKKVFTHFELELFAGVRNVFDRKYASMILINAGSFGGNLPRYYYPGNPRHWFLGGEVRYFLK